MKILVTGANGFIGKNLIVGLKQREDAQVFPVDMDTPEKQLEAYCRECEFVYNLAGINRPKRTEEFMEGNFGFAETLIRTLKKYGNRCPVMHASSVQASLDNPYGRSKKAGEDVLFAYGRDRKVPVYIYRFPNVFGKWCRPDYNSAIATFCHNISRNMPIVVKDESVVMRLVYIDDVVEELLRALDGKPRMNADGYCYVPVEYTAALGEIVSMLYKFRESRNSLVIPDMTAGSLEKKLYSTYLSYLPPDGFSYPLLMHEDARGSFTEILKSPDRGQVSVNISRPGIIRGNHWHHTKNEKFVVVSGKGCVRFRKHGEENVSEYHVSGEKLEVIDIPAGYVHAILNEGNTDLVTFMWCNECFCPDQPDTIYEEV